MCAVASVSEIRQAAHQIAETHRQELVQQKVEVEDPAIFREDLSTILRTTESCWISYYTHNKDHSIIGHILGVIPTGENEYLRWNSTAKRHISNLSFDELADEVLSDRHNLFPDVYLFGFISRGRAAI